MTAIKVFRVLIVDDYPDYRELLALNLRRRGYEVSVAATGSEALECVAQERFHVALIDIGLPDMSGSEVARRVRALPEGAKTSLIALTGTDLPEGDAAGADFDTYLVKPVATSVLVKLLDSAKSALAKKEFTGAAKACIDDCCTASQS